MNDTSGTRATIHRGMSSEQAFGTLLHGVGRKIEQHLGRVADTMPPESVHKARVGLRRLTTLLDAFRPLFRRKEAKRWRGEAKAIFRALGRVRDADVYLAGLPDAKRTRKLVGETAWLRERTRQELQRSGAPSFTDRFGEAFATGDILRRSDEPGRPIEERARAALSDAWAALGGHGADLAAMSADDRHGFRKDMKTFRYLSEFFTPLWPEASPAEIRARIEALQEDLGQLNDMANARRRRKGADEDATARAAEGLVLERASATWRELAGLPRWWEDPVEALSPAG